MLKPYKSLLGFSLILKWFFFFNFTVGITKETQNLVNSLADSDGASEESAEPAETENECAAVPHSIPQLNRVHRGSLTKKTSKHQASHPLYQRDTSNLDTPKVAALEVQNVKRAINRYGTLPKGARIGAYLESLRHGGESAVDPAPIATAKPPANLQRGAAAVNVPLRRPFQQPGNMTRSNSSTNFQPSSPRTIRAHHLQQQQQQQPPPNLADLEFPPPPPPEDLDHEEEMSTFRFGVSLRHREPSTDSCNSAKSEPTARLKGGGGIGAGRVKDGGNSSSSSSSRPLAAAEPHAKQPASTFEPSPLMPKKNAIVAASPSSDEDGKDVKNLVPDIMKEMMELKHCGGDGGGIKTAAAKSAKDEQQRSVSPVDFKTGLRKVKDEQQQQQQQPPNRQHQHHHHHHHHRGELQRIDTNIAEIKSQLKKVKIDDKKDGCENNGALAESNSDNNDGDAVADDKRRSTGSISSLKKLWEGESPPSETAAAATTSGGKERRVWPPPPSTNPPPPSSSSSSQDDHPSSSSSSAAVVHRPAVPVKPAKSSGPPTSTAAAKSNSPAAIYATPGPTATSSLVEQWRAVDGSLRAMRDAPVTSAGWLQLSDTVGGFHASCLHYADTAAPPNLRFLLRELLNKLESQSRQMRSAGGGRQQAADQRSAIFQTLDATLKDILNIIQR